MITITNIHKNIMGTTSFDLIIKGWKKPQEFCVYPIGRDSSKKNITIQSDKRYGKINTELGKIVLSKSHTNSCSVHLQMDIAYGREEHYELTKEQLAELTEFIIETASAKAGTKGTGIFTDNSGAINLMSL